MLKENGGGACWPMFLIDPRLKVKEKKCKSLQVWISPFGAWGTPVVGTMAELKPGGVSSRGYSVPHRERCYNSNWGIYLRTCSGLNSIGCDDVPGGANGEVTQAGKVP